jgi:hypothetical protein
VKDWITLLPPPRSRSLLKVARSSEAEATKILSREALDERGRKNSQVKSRAVAFNERSKG